jgi:hypothetical protein
LVCLHGFCYGVHPIAVASLLTFSFVLLSLPSSPSYYLSSAPGRCQTRKYYLSSAPGRCQTRKHFVHLYWWVLERRSAEDTVCQARQSEEHTRVRTFRWR